ncbi:hypothetical protein J7L84_01585 [Candidatus Bipolaricaulota bacterium]|nr:hypothetical protein [Candidatus Bipolaricaulota bacterium]
MKGKWSVVVLVGALVLGIAGGLLGGKLGAGKKGELESLSGDLAALEKRVSTLEERISGVDLGKLLAELSQLRNAVSSLQEEVKGLRETGATGGKAPVQTGGTAAGIRLASVDLEALLSDVLLPSTQAAKMKQEEMDDLRSHYQEGKIDEETYKRELLKLEVELLDIKLRRQLDLIHRMISSEEFSDIRGDLSQLEDKISPLEDEVQSLMEQAKQGVKEEKLQDFLGKYQELYTIFQQLEQLLSQTIMAKFAQIAAQIAKERGYAVLIRVQDALYVDPSQVDDLTPAVKERLKELF